MEIKIKIEDKILNINEKLNIFYSSYKPVNLDEFRNKKLMAVAGIGNPDNFFQLLEENNLFVEKKLIFPDHYNFSKNEIQKIINDAKRKNYQIIMTEKDYYKIKDDNKNQVKFLKVMLKIENQEKLIKIINKGMIKKLIIFTINLCLFLFLVGRLLGLRLQMFVCYFFL